jgi:hypothetical protein
VIDVSDETSYLTAVVQEFRRDASEVTGFELRKRLWHSCVVICEVTKTGYQDWHLTLAKYAVEALAPESGATADSHSGNEALRRNVP